MNISLRPIDKNNWRECIKLKITDEQKRFVGSNENSLAMCYVYPEITPLGIYLDEKIIGFITQAFDAEDKVHYVNRFMIDENYQRKGYGTKALCLLIEKLKNEGAETLEIIHKPDNYSAIKIYESLGFILTETKVGDDVVSALKISAN